VFQPHSQCGDVEVVEIVGAGVESVPLLMLLICDLVAVAVDSLVIVEGLLKRLLSTGSFLMC
jgi:hypothetical protein